VLHREGIGAAEAEAIVLALQMRPLPSHTFDDVARSLLAYADKLTLTPGQVGAADVSMLRTAGLDDRAIHDACAIVAYFAFVNRVADGLGVDLET
jgi:alkylhydroperoxidase family enzyme